MFSNRDTSPGMPSCSPLKARQNWELWRRSRAAKADFKRAASSSCQNLSCMYECCSGFGTWIYSWFLFIMFPGEFSKSAIINISRLSKKNNLRVRCWISSSREKEAESSPQLHIRTCHIQLSTNLADGSCVTSVPEVTPSMRRSTMDACLAVNATRCSIQSCESMNGDKADGI